MRARRAAALAASALVLAPGLAACGGGQSAKQATAEKAKARAELRHWRQGLMRWHASTQHALDGISIIFSTEESLVAVGRGGNRTSTSLVSYENVLMHCTSTVRGLGAVPPGLELAGRYALAACSSLEKGGQSVLRIVHNLRRGNGYETLDPLQGADDFLSTGQAQLTTAAQALNSPPLPTS